MLNTSCFVVQGEGDEEERRFRQAVERGNSEKAIT